MVAFGIAGTAFAAEVPEPDPAQPVVVQVKGKVEEYDARRYDTGAKIVVGREELSRFGDTAVSDVLKRQPGITVDSAGAISMRGLGNGYTQILLNGEPVPTGFSIDSLTPDLIERVEVLRTATADLRGEGIAGTVNIILKKVPRKTQNSAKLHARRERGQPNIGASWEHAVRGEKASYSLAGAASRNDFLYTSRNVTTGTDVQGTPNLVRNGGFDMFGRIDQLSLTPNMSTKLGNGDTVSIQTFLSRIKLKKDGHGFSNTTSGAPDPYATYTQLTDETSTQLRADTAWLHRIAPDTTFDFQLKLSSNRRNYDFNENGYSIAGVPNLYDDTAAKVRDDSLRNNGKYSRRLSEHNTLVTGWDAELNRRYEDRFQVLRNEQDTAPRVLPFDFDARIKRLGVYAQTEWTPTPSLSVYLGVRDERVIIESEGSGFTALRRTEHMLSPIANVLWKIPGSDEKQVRAGVSRTYRSPALSALIPRPYTSTNNSPLEPDTRGKPDLRAERALGLDLAYEHHWSKGSLVSIGGYVRKISDQIRDVVLLEGTRWVSQPINGGDAVLRGLEMDTRFKLTDLLAAAPKVDIRFNATRNWSSVRDLPGPDNGVPGQQRFSATLGADYEASERWALGGAYTYKSANTSRSMLNRYNFTGVRREIDVFALYKLASRSRLRFTLSNLLHQDRVGSTRIVEASGEQRFREEYTTSPLAVGLMFEWAP